MQLSILLLPLLGGYLFCRACEKYKYSLDRRKGYDLFFMSAVAGTVLWIGCFAIAGPLSYIALWGFSHVSAWSLEVANTFACLATFASGNLLARFANRYIDADEQVNRQVKEEGDALEQLLREAYFADKLLMVTLESGKVYVGFATSNADPYGDRRYFRLLKASSGYRTYRKNVAIETRYDKVLGDIGAFSEDENVDRDAGSDFHVILPKQRVAYANIFDPKLAKRFSNPPSGDAS